MPKPVLLHVEDEDAAVFLLKTALEEASINVEFHRVSDGEQALAFLRKTGVYAKAPDPNLVLLDLNLPRVTGFEVLEQLLGSAAQQTSPVIVFTSSALSADRQRAMSLGARQFVTKPGNLDEFIASVESMCGFLRDSEAA